MIKDDVKVQLQTIQRTSQKPIDPALLAAIEKLADNIQKLETRLVSIDTPHFAGPVRAARRTHVHQ